MESATITDELAKEVFIRFHKGDESQADIATHYNLPRSTVNVIVLGQKRFAALKQEFPTLNRSTKKMKKVKPEPEPKEVKAPVKIDPAPTPAAVAEEEEDSEAVQIAERVLEYLPGLSAERAVILSRFATDEMTELLSIIQDKPDRLLQYLPKAGRPRKVAA